MTTGSGRPVVSLCYISKSPRHNNIQLEGLFVGHLNSCSFVELNNNGSIKAHPLLIEGLVRSISFDRITNHILISCKPSQKYHPQSRHIICQLITQNLSTDPQNSPNSVVFLNILHIFYGSTTQKLLSRTSMLPCPVKSKNAIAEYAIAEQSKAYPRLTLAKIIIAEQSPEAACPWLTLAKIIIAERSPETAQEKPVVLPPPPVTEFC